MTSQVAVSNLYGVAVASDTVSSRTTSGGLKTVGHINKIYEVGLDHQVLVLHSNSTFTNDVPTWLLVTEWSRTIKSPLETVQDYIDSFLRWSSEAAPLHSRDSEQTAVKRRIDLHLKSIYRSVMEDISNFEKVSGTSSMTLKDKKALVLKHVSSCETYLETCSRLEGLDDEFAHSLLAEIADDYARMLSHYFGEFGYTKRDEGHFTKSAIAALSSFDYYPCESDDDSYLAFVGFGSTEAFASNRQVALRGFYRGKLLVSQLDVERTGPNHSSSGISFFAQDDAIQSFIRGFHIETLGQVESLVRSAIRDTTNTSIADFQVENIVSSVSDGVKNFTFKRFVQPLLNEVDGMNRTRLAEFAESLVGLQATAAKAQDGPATVGGFIEVATIDKSNGVRWVKSLEAGRVA